MERLKLGFFIISTFILIIILYVILNTKVQYSYCIDWTEDNQRYTACDMKYIKLAEYLMKEDK